VTAAEDPTLKGRESPLPYGDILVRGQSVFQKGERSPWAKNPMDFSQGVVNLGNRAKRHRAQHVINRLVIEIDLRSIEAHEVDRESATFDAWSSQATPDDCRIDGQEALNTIW
jgi:hypothetical protein